MYAAILIRSTIGANPEIRETLKRLNLERKNSLVLLEENSVNKGMLKKVESYITYGIVSEEFAKELVEKKGEEVKDPVDRKPKQKIKKHVKSKILFGKKIKPAIRLHPPRGGFERRGIKKSYSEKGVLGLRDNIEDLIKRMM